MAAPHFPVVGDTLGDFRLIGELGRGAHGRVFLAAQAGLADRPVVLKVTPQHDREFLSLARLQHTHVIPLFGVYDFPEHNLRALCQPYFGGATLARLLDALGPSRPNTAAAERSDGTGPRCVQPRPAADARPAGGFGEGRLPRSDRVDRRVPRHALHYADERGASSISTSSRRTC